MALQTKTLTSEEKSFYGFLWNSIYDSVYSKEETKDLLKITLSFIDGKDYLADQIFRDFDYLVFNIAGRTCFFEDLMFACDKQLNDLLSVYCFLLSEKKEEQEKLLEKQKEKTYKIIDRSLEFFKQISHENNFNRVATSPYWHGVKLLLFKEYSESKDKFFNHIKIFGLQIKDFF